ncbi:hypothetical protein E0493_02695 [Roseomonas sp. M0104]|uniref:Uncharacterized protein n=1 Tax=Teichococcus coralli TaxID=2545983 RepID=A0A845B707_9PROT|nr:hypothetical protein [Pseudoroseomonas coralli]MXP62258.1 hypothetical protein [Pseudoroseomonas coralli]
MLAALRTAEAQQAAGIPFQPSLLNQALSRPLVAPAALPPLLNMLGTVQPPSGLPASAPVGPPPLLAALSSPPQPVTTSLAGEPAAAPIAAASTGLGDLLRRIGQPAAPPARPAPVENAVPDVLRALRLTGLG